MKTAPKKILLADDEMTIRSLVRATLEGPDCRIMEASDGEEALRMVADDRPDLVILDWSMPRLRGIEVARQLRSSHATRGIPIILLTARADDADFDAARELGVNAYLVKPFSPIELIEEVDTLLHAASRAGR